MKKLYAILACAIMVLGAFMADAATKHYQPIVTPEAQMLLTKRAYEVSKTAEFTPGTELIGTRSYTTGNMLYTLRFIRDYENEWYKVLVFVDPDTGEQIPVADNKFTDFPFYTVMMVLVGYDISTGQATMDTYLPFYTVWPSKYWFSQQYEVAGEPIPEDERDYSMVTIDELCNAKAKGLCGLFREWKEINGGFNPSPYLNSNNEIEAWCITSGGFMKESVGAQLIFKNQECTTYTSGNQIMEWDFRGYLEETGEISVGLKYPLQFQTSTGSTRQQTLNVAYQGTYRSDLVPVTINTEMSDVHIFYTGEASSKIFGNKDPYLFSQWGPLDRYYMFAPLADYIDVKLPADLKEFNQDKIGFIFNDKADAQVQLDPESQSYIFGTYYQKTGSGKPTGHYTMLAPEYEYDPVWGYILSTKPEAGTLIPAYSVAVYDKDGKPVNVDTSYIELDGFNVVYLGGNQNLVAGAQSVIGSKKGIEVVGTDLYDNTFTANFSGKYKFHADPKNVQAFEEVESIGELEGVDEVTVNAENNIFVADGKVLVNATKDIEVIVYTLDGVAVKALNVKAGDLETIELGKGLYIVKAGNDVVKVAL